MQKKKVMVLLAVVVVICGVVFTWAILPKKTEQGNSKDTTIERVEENKVAEEEETEVVKAEKFTWKEEASTAKEEMIVVKDTKIYSKPTRDYDSQVLGDLALDQIGTNLASCLSDEGVDLMWNKVDFNGVIGYVDILDVNFNVSLEDDWLANEPVEESESKGGVSSETESIIEVEETKTDDKSTEQLKDETKKEEAKTEEPKKEEPKEEKQKVETPAPAPQPEPAPAPEPTPAPQQSETVVIGGTTYNIPGLGGNIADIPTREASEGNPEGWNNLGLTVE